MQICNDVLLDMPDCCKDSQVGFTFKSFIVTVAQFALISFYF